ncbi:MAG: hypothetical protein ACLP5H_30550 [Desulfomonilaceae bacterium]
MKRLATIMSDLIPLALTMMFVIVVVLTLSHVTDDPATAMSERPSKTQQVCPSATAAHVAETDSVNEAARSGELDRYIASQYP